VFPTTVWTTIRRAAGSDEEARDAFARAYRGPVVRYLRRKGVDAEEADDLCQEVFLRLWKEHVLERADRSRGRFRGLLSTVTRRALYQRRKQRVDAPAEDLDPADGAHPDGSDPDFDREWAVELVQRAFERLRDDGSPYAPVLEAHLAGSKPDRNKLWIARRKLLAGIRHEVALTCNTAEELEEELAHLHEFLRPGEKS
jgi:RNA polymerase sigma factor (sigma-70 family)